MRLDDLMKELDRYAPKRTGTIAELEVQASHAYEAVQRFILQVNSTLTDEQAEDIIKRFFNAAKTADKRKLDRGFAHLNGEESSGTSETHL